MRLLGEQRPLLYTRWGMRSDRDRQTSGQEEDGILAEVSEK
jgi:hypothetical protein